MSDFRITEKVIAPNGKSVVAHQSRNAVSSAYVYVKGHRVYGRLSSLNYTADAGYFRSFSPEGKYAFLLAPDTSAPLSQRVEGADIEAAEAALAQS